MEKLVFHYGQMIQKNQERSAEHVTQRREKIRYAKHLQYGIKIKTKPINGRCKLHGGLSTGARTEKGREAIRESNRRRAKMKESFSGEQNI